MNEKLELIIREKYADLRKSEKRAADYLLQYEGDGRTLTLEQFAAGANVSQPTVLRFLRALGYKGFKDFRYVLAQKEPEEKENGYFLYGSTVMEGDTISELPAKLIGTSIGQLKDTLKNLSAAELEKGDLAIGISYSGCSISTVDAMRIAKKAGAKTIAITNFENTLLEKYADIVLVTSNQHFLYGDAIFSQVSQLAVVDMIYTGVLLSDYDRYTKILDRSSKIISKQAYPSQDDD